MAGRSSYPQVWGLDRFSESRRVEGSHGRRKLPRWSVIEGDGLASRPQPAFQRCHRCRCGGIVDHVSMGRGLREKYSLSHPSSKQRAQDGTPSVFLENRVSHPPTLICKFRKNIFTTPQFARRARLGLGHRVCRRQLNFAEESGMLPSVSDSFTFNSLFRVESTRSLCLQFYAHHDSTGNG